MADPRALAPPLFKSFWQGGFESATHRNSRGVRVDMVAATQHDREAAGDYARLRTLGICVAREGVRWHLVERGEGFDFESLAPLMAASAQHGIQIVWTLCHYGWPDGLDPFVEAFVERFARYCGAVAEHIANHDAAVPIYSPINEISFLAFAAGQIGWFHPYAVGRGDELKAQLVRAAIAGIEAIWAVEARARIVHVDPLIHVVAPLDRPDLAPLAALQDDSQFEAWDWLAGRARPELGGAARFLDIVGANYYHSNQWVYPDLRLRWEDVPPDPRRVPLDHLLARLYARYQRPLFVAETSHFGAGRGRWIRDIAADVARAQAAGVPVEGICLYPILDRPDWEDSTHWHRSGVWDLVADDQGRLQRRIDEGYAATLGESQRLLTGRFPIQPTSVNGSSSAIASAPAIAEWRRPIGGG